MAIGGKTNQLGKGKHWDGFSFNNSHFDVAERFPFLQRNCARSFLLSGSCYSSQRQITVVISSVTFCCALSSVAQLKNSLVEIPAFENARRLIV